MTLGDILKKGCEDDLAHLKKDATYEEFIKGGSFWIRLSSKQHKEAFIECSAPFIVITEELKNYTRLYFLSMLYNAAIYGMKKQKHRKK